MTCDTCSNLGFVFSCNEAGENEVQRCDACALYDSDQQIQHILERKRMNNATIINVAYVWRDMPEDVRYGKMAIADGKLTLDEWDELLEREDVLYVFEAGERPMSDLFEFKILSMEGVV